MNMQNMFTDRLLREELDTQEVSRLRRLFYLFTKKVTIDPNREKCWEWNAAKNEHGYGRLNLNKKSLKAHRVSFELFVGSIPHGMVVMHSCDNPTCSNPYHLQLGTQADNVRDMIQKGRAVIRTQKLNDFQVLEIRKRYEQGETQEQIARDFGIHRAQVSKIVNRVGWKHVA